MKLIVGLGNPGEKYEKTKHNLGFVVVDQFLKDFESTRDTIWKDNKKFKSDIAEIEWNRRCAGSGQAITEKVILVKPKTYMNNSGMAVKLLVTYYKIPTSDVWIVADELDLPLGSMKIRFGGASAGHNGVASVIESLGTDKFWRVRLGIGTEKVIEKMAKHKVKNTEDYVLSSFAGGEKGKVKNLIKNAAAAIKEMLENGEQSAMNKFNTR